jgi:hypothetical protein
MSRGAVGAGFVGRRIIMKWAIGLVLVGGLCAGVMAEPVTYTFGATSGSVSMRLSSGASTSSGMSGTFAVTVDGSDRHVGTGDAFLLEDSRFSNTDTLKLGLAGLATVTIRPNSVRFLDFAPAGPGQILGNLVPSPIDSDVYVQLTTFVTGLTTSPMRTSRWMGYPLPFTMAFTTSNGASSVITGILAGTFRQETPIPDIAMTLTLDLVLTVEGTAHAVPDPALSGLAALGIGGAGVWLRRR